MFIWLFTWFNESRFFIGVYLGDDKVVHFTRLGQEVGTGTGLDVLIISSMPPPRLVTCPTCNHTDISNGIITSCLNCFLNGGLLYRFEYSVNPVVFLANPRGGTCTLAASDPPETVIHRANYLVKNGFGCYNILKNNCIHFAIYCKTGRLVSDKKTMSPSRLMASIIGQPLGLSFLQVLSLWRHRVWLHIVLIDMLMILVRRAMSLASIGGCSFVVSCFSCLHKDLLPC